MPIGRVKHWAAGDELSANDLENEFNNIADNALVEPFVVSQPMDLNGQVLILDADGDTLLDASTDDQIDVTIAGADDFRFAANTFTALSGSSIVVEAGDLTVSDGATVLSHPDTRTATVATPVTVRAVTSGGPAAGIGTGILFQAESVDEDPSDVGQTEFSFSDVSAGSEDSYFQVLLRVAGAALTACWRWAATGAFNGILTHANTADRTYTFPNRDTTVGAGDIYMGPSSTGSGSAFAHEGTVTISASQALDGVHCYNNFTLDAGKTLTLDNNSHRLVILANGVVTINGTIDAVGAGSSGGTGAVSPTAGQDGFASAGGGGAASSTGVSGAAGGKGLVHGITLVTGGAGGVGANGHGGNATTLASYNVGLGHALSIMGGAGGGGGAAGGGTPGQGGRGGGSIVLIAPTVILGAAAVLNTSGAAGGTGSVQGGGGGGGGAGNVIIICQSYTNNGATFTMVGGNGGTGNNGIGGDGSAGVKQIFIYA